MSLFSSLNVSETKTDLPLPLDGQISNLFGSCAFQLAQDWSSAIQACLLANGIGEGDEVIMPALAPAGLAQAIALVGATPVFVDVESDSLLASHRAIERALSTDSKAVIVSHLYGQIFNSPSLYESLKDHDILLIEDGSDAFLSLAQTDKSIESAFFSIARHCDYLVTCPPMAREPEAHWPAFIFSRNEESLDKLVVWQGEQNPDCWHNLHSASTGLVSSTQDLSEQSTSRLVNYMESLKADKNRLKEQIALYQSAFAQAPVRLLKPRQFSGIGQTLMPIHVPPALRDTFFAELREAGFSVYQTYRSLPDLSYFQQKFGTLSCPNAQRWTKGAFSLPTGPLIGRREQSMLIQQLKQSCFNKILAQLSH